MIIPASKTWPDQCNHPLDSYMGSFHCVGATYDLYLLERGNDQGVCLRYGAEPGAYMGATSMVQLVTLAVSAPEYADALELLQSHGRFRFERHVHVVDEL